MASDLKVKKLAVLIDADNAQASMAGALLAEIAKYGTAFVKRAYGDWTGPSLKGWKEQLLENSIQPIQQFAYTQGKNSTDAAMVIDAMDLLYTNRFDGFCIVSSDSDFTRLASRIRESGLTVYGFGNIQTPNSLVTACDKFVYIENLSRKGGDSQQKSGNSQLTDISMNEPPAPVADITDYNKAQWLIRKAIESTSDDDGWANLASVGGIITKWQPDFDARTYGFDKLSHLIYGDPLFEVIQRVPLEGKPPVVYARDKHRAP